MCSIISRVMCAACLKKARKMDPSMIMTAFANSGAGKLVSQIGSGLGVQGQYYLGNLTGYNQRLRDDQAMQEERLTGIQLAANKEQMAYNQELNKNMYEYTGYASKVRQMKDAGLNPALMYAGGGAGGGVTGNVSGGAGKGNASDEVSRRMADISSMGMALQNAKLAAEVRNLEVDADLKESTKDLNVAKTMTEDQQRDYLLEQLRLNGVDKFIDIVRKEWEQSNSTEDEDRADVVRNAKLNWTTNITGNSTFAKGLTTSVLKTQAETGNIMANKILTDKKAEGYYQELLNATSRADSDRIRALSTKLATDWGTGEYVNWRSVADMASSGLNLLSKIKP